MNRDLLEKNLLALRAAGGELYSRLAGRTVETNRYTFTKSRSGETIPALPQPHGDSRPLHSTIDPKREAQRLVSAIEGDFGFLIFLGLGGAFAPQAALESTDAQVVVIEYDIDGIAELFSAIDYTKLLNNDRFTLLADPSNEEIKNFILENYKPSLCGGIKIIPLRTRVETDTPLFDSAANAIQTAIEIVSADYSVQAHFGKRWFSNIIRNIRGMQTGPENFLLEKTVSEKHEAAIVAAGPSLDRQLPAISDFKSNGVFIISSDTALPVLSHNGIEPDAVVSIDCQHISYYHFLGCALRNIPLFLDIASPPMLSRLSPSPVFFSSGHPLALYVRAHWRPFMRLDTSGGNVTYACLSLAENLSFQRITLFGADFSYVQSQSYARGTYIYPFFEKKQNRLCPLEAQFSAFFYRSPFMPPENGEKKNYYETSSLRFYRKKLEEKANTMTANVSCAKGLGAPVSLRKAPSGIKTTEEAPCACGTVENISGVDFLEQYGRKIAALPAAKSGENYIKKLNAQEKQVFTTLLPYTAAIKKQNTELKFKDLIEEVKRRSVEEIERLIT
jgi:hypothetical protein